MRYAGIRAGIEQVLLAGEVKRAVTANTLMQGDGEDKEGQEKRKEVGGIRQAMTRGEPLFSDGYLWQTCQWVRFENMQEGLL